MRERQCTRHLVSLLLIGLAASLVLSGCTVFPQREPNDVYHLPASELRASAEAPRDMVLRVSRPFADEIQGGTQIVVSPDGMTLMGYQQSRWSSPVPVLLRDHLMEAFRNDGRLAGIVSDREGLSADRELSGYLRAYRVEYEEGVPYARVVFDANLIDLAQNRVVRSQRFEVHEALEDEPVEYAVRAFWRATESLSRDVVDWSLSQ